MKTLIEALDVLRDIIYISMIVIAVVFLVSLFAYEIILGLS